MSSWDKLNTRVKAAFIKRAVANGVSDLDRIIQLFNEAEQAKQSDELLYQDFKRSLPKPLQDESQYRLRDYWEYNNRPSNFVQGVQRGMFIPDTDAAFHANSVQYNPNTGNTEFMKHKDHPTVDLELLQFYNNPELKEFRERHNLDMSGDYYKYVPKNKFGEGGDYTMMTEPNMIKTGMGIFPEDLYLHRTPADKRLGLTFVDNGGNPIRNNDNQEALAYKTPEGHFVDFNLINKYNYLPEMGEGDLRGVYAGSLPELTIQKPAHGNSILNKLQGLITPPSTNIGSSPWESVEIKSNDMQGKVPERLFHQVKPGQNLTQIAQNYGMTVNELSKYNPQLKNLNFIKPGDTIYLSPDEHKRKINAKEEWEKEKTANLSNLSAIHSVQHEGNYVIINKAKGEFSIFNSSGKKIKTIKVETGKSGDDYHTKTYPDENGHIIPGIGNMSTPAGISFITGTGTYMGQPSFQRRRAGYDAKKGAMESSLHAGYTGTNVYTSNGCVRIQNKDLQELGKYIKYDTPIYTLPDKPGSRFVISQGRLNFQADNPYGDQDKSNPKWQWDDYDIYTDRTYAPVSVSYSIDKNADKKYARNVKEYVMALVNNKEALQKELRINSYLYNKLMYLALGITQQESKFGTHPKYLIKQDVNRSMPDIVYEGVLDIGRFIKTRGRKGIAAPSRGINQIKMRDDNKATQEAYRKFGVTESSVQNSIEKSAIATMIRLSRMYLDEIGGRDFFDEEGNKMDPFDVLLYKYMGRNDLLKAGATPNKNKYLKQVKQYSAPFNIYEYR